MAAHAIQSFQPPLAKGITISIVVSLSLKEMVYFNHAKKPKLKDSCLVHLYKRIELE
jgi:hypothetical protein